MEITDPLQSEGSYVRAAAAEIELTIADEYLIAVEEDFARARTIARFLTEFPLEQNVEAAPVFQP